MTFPDPHPGLVIHYAYLWKREHDEGHEEDGKNRPCAIVLSVLDDDGEQEVMVLPITPHIARHSARRTPSRFRPRPSSAWDSIPSGPGS